MKIRLSKVSDDNATEIIEINSLEDLKLLVAKHKRNLIFGYNSAHWDNQDEPEYSILIYDDYLE